MILEILAVPFTKISLKGVKFQKAPAIDSGNEAVGLHPNLLGEIVSKMSPRLLPGAVCHNRQDGIHRERQIY